MAGIPAETLVLAVYVLTVALSSLIAPAIAFAERKRSATAAVGLVVGNLAALVTLSATVLAALTTPLSGVVAFLAGFGLLLILVVVPLLIGRAVVRSRTGVDRERALVLAVTGWPVALAGSLALYWGVTAALAWPLSALSWLGWAVLVLSGPGVLGVTLHRVFGRFR
jgi:hypothetical protein